MGKKPGILKKYADNRITPNIPNSLACETCKRPNDGTVTGTHRHSHSFKWYCEKCCPHDDCVAERAKVRA